MGTFISIPFNIRCRRRLCARLDYRIRRRKTSPCPYKAETVLKHSQNMTCGVVIHIYCIAFHLEINLSIGRASVLRDTIIKLHPEYLSSLEITYLEHFSTTARFLQAMLAIFPWTRGMLALPSIPRAGSMSTGIPAKQIGHGASAQAFPDDRNIPKKQF